MPLILGTSGWQYPHWRTRFYPKSVPQSRWLEYYAERFQTVEVNNSFYMLPKPATWAAWRDRTPDDFIVAAKASRYLTHIRRLREPADSVQRFVDSAAGLGTKLGPVLLQLPPRFRAVAQDLDETLRQFPEGMRIAVEPRDPSWWCDDIRTVLEARGAALCWADRYGRPVTETWRTAGWGYVRFHEGCARDRPSYGRRALTAWIERLSAAFRPEEDVYVYFNNDPNMGALRDVVRFAHLATNMGWTCTRVPSPADVELHHGVWSSPGVSPSRRAAH